MKVLIISHLFPNEVDPISGLFVREQVRCLKKQCEIKVIAPIPWFPPLRGFGRWSRLSKIPYRQKVEDIELLHPRCLLFPRRMFFSTIWLFYLLTLLRIGRELDFNLIHAHCAYPDGLAAVLFGKIVGKPVLITAHGSDVKIYPKEHKAWRILTAWALSQADRIIAVSSELKREIGKLGVDLGKVRVIFNGVDTGLFHLLSKPAVLRQKGLSNIKRVIYVGRLDRQKGIMVLLQVMANLIVLEKDLELVVVGTNKGKKEDEEVIATARGLGLRKRVRFVDMVPIAEVPLWLAVSDVFVLPSFSEGLPLALVEALACGKPVVSTTCGGPEDIVTEEVGILVPPGDAKALADAIGYVLDHPEQYDATKISSYASERFSLEKISTQIFDLYSSLFGDAST